MLQNRPGEIAQRRGDKAQREGDLPGRIGAPHLHYLFAGATATIFHQAPECRRLFGVDPSDPEVVESHADALVQLFLGDAALGREADPDASAKP